MVPLAVSTQLCYHCATELLQSTHGGMLMLHSVIRMFVVFLYVVFLHVAECSQKSKGIVVDAHIFCLHVHLQVHALGDLCQCMPACLQSIETHSERVTKRNSSQLKLATRLPP